MGWTNDMPYVRIRIGQHRKPKSIHAVDSPSRDRSRRILRRVQYTGLTRAEAKAQECQGPTDGLSASVRDRLIAPADGLTEQPNRTAASSSGSAIGE